MKEKLVLDVPSREECISYLVSEGLMNHINVGEWEKPSYGIFDTVDSSYMTPLAPEYGDLYRLHRLIRSRKAFNVLEFGLGYSTIVMADALKKNSDEYYALKEPVKVRIRDPFQVYSVDASQYWIEHFHNQYADFPSIDRVHVSYSSCQIGEHNGQICHFYNNIPNVIADFIYLDGPSPNDVEGQVNGIEFADCHERTVMSGDLLKLEPTFLPGTMILVDGRTNNARFLANNFKRKYTMTFSEVHDTTAFELLEAPLGRINRAQIDYSLGSDYYHRLGNLNAGLTESRR